MVDEMKANPRLLNEYETTFDSEEKVTNALKITKNNFTITTGVVEFDSLLIPDPMKKGRKETFLGLSTSIAELGILSPIHVMITDSYTEWVKTHESTDVFDGFKYILLDGFRRVWGGCKNGLERSNAIIWDFKDKDKGTELSTFLSLVLNKVQKRSWGEIWYLYQILEVQSALTPGTLEYLLQLDPGDAMKLKDIMSCDYADVKEELLSNKKTIAQAYSLLQKYRKEEDQLLKEDNKGIADLDQADGVIEKGKNSVLSNDEVKEILEMEDNFDTELSDSNFDGDLSMDDISDRQKVGERHPLDPALRAETMIRDNYTCQCCGAGAEMSMMSKLSILQSHHKISVSNSGPDTKENITTLCMVCHTLIHVLGRHSLRFGISKEEFDGMSEPSKEQHKKIMALARVDWEAGTRLGKNKEEIKKDNSDYYKFKMPGTDLAQNSKAIQEYKKEQNK